MTAGNPSDSQVYSPTIQTSLRSPSPVDNHVIVVKEHELSNPSPNNARWLKRLVSQDEMTMLDVDSEKSKPQYISGGEEEESGGLTSHRLDSPLRCVSDYDKAFMSCSSSVDKSADDDWPPLPNPLYNRDINKTHTSALRLEAELFPMRQILSRLMSHVTYNRKGLFNSPVDPVALNLPDYHTIISKPMDLGTVKSGLHSLSYQSREQVYNDIKLVFCNAMKYNPAGNLVHIAARELLAFFETDCQGLGPMRTTDQPSDSLKKQKLISEIPGDSYHISNLSAEVGPENFTTGFPDKVVKSPTGILRTVSEEAVTAVPDHESPMSCSTIQTQSESLSIQNGKGAGMTKFFSPKTHSRKRKLRTSAARVSFHSCQYCRGRVCVLCEQGCLPLEPVLLICSGANCAGAKIRKGAMYYIARDGSRQYCQKCYIGLAAVLPQTNNDDKETVRYKRDLLKRKNEEETVEPWLTCTRCGKGLHSICAMHNHYVHSEENYVCPLCSSESDCDLGDSLRVTPYVGSCETYESTYSFLSGSDMPVRITEICGPSFRTGHDVLSADALPKTAVSSFIQSKVRERIAAKSHIPNAEKTVTVRIISECSRFFNVPDVIRKHFRMATMADAKKNTSADCVITPPKKVKYNSKAIALFQKVDGLDVCIFCMYVHEYDGDDEYDEAENLDQLMPRKKRTYIAYLDSVEHLRPRRCRTAVYHEILVSYLATARNRGYESAHIWACPPSRGNCFVFWNHPSCQRTPSTERLLGWYHGALNRAIECGVVTDVKSLYESDFEPHIREIEKKSETHELGESSGKMVCPPLFDGDFWVEEAVRVHGANITRYQKTTPSAVGEVCDRCPAGQVAMLLRDRIIGHPSAAAFRRPVNAAAMKLKDYHKIITKPMDLGTVYSRCVLGEYVVLRELVEDVELVFSNARRYNPKGHFVHTKAVEMECLFFEQLNILTSVWSNDSDASWQSFADMSMSLDKSLELIPSDEGSLDGSRVAESVPSAPAPETEGVSETSLQFQTTAGQKNPTSRLPDSQSPVGCRISKSSLSDSHTVEKGKINYVPMTKCELLSGGPNAVNRRMVGEDVWLLDKKNPTPPKHLNISKKACGRRRRNSLENVDDSPKRRRQTWLGEEIGASVRKMRNCFFTCSLVPDTSCSEERAKLHDFESYSGSYSDEYADEAVISSRVADARHALLEFSQFRNFEFDTIRHAKYSTAMLLYHLHNHDAPGMVPACTSCESIIQRVRWHKVKKIAERRRIGKTGSTTFTNVVFEKPEELCSSCHEKHPRGDEFIPVQVSYSV